MRGRLINTLALPLMPLMLAQGRRLHEAIPRMLPAYGPRQGHFEGTGEPLRLLMYGESTALGVGVQKIEQAVVCKLAELLNKRSGRAIAWETVGRPGVTVRESHTHVLPKVAAAPRDLVVVLFGANDALARRHASEFIADMRELVDKLRERVGEATIVFSSVPPLGTFPALPQPLRYYLGAWSRWLDAHLARLILPGAHYVPVHIPMPATLFAEDGFHPGASGYQVWAEILATTIFKLGLVQACEAPPLARPLMIEEAAPATAPKRAESICIA